MPGLWLRGFVWQFRVRVPQTLVPIFGRTHVNRSLHTSDPREAARLVRIVAGEVEQTFRTLMSNSVSPEQSGTVDTSGLAEDAGERLDTPKVSRHAEGMPSVTVDIDNLVTQVASKLRDSVPDGRPMPTTTPSAPPSTSIREAYNLFMADPSRMRSGKTVVAYQTVFRLLCELVGAETPVEALTRQWSRQFIDLLRHLPPNHTKMFPGVPAPEIVKQLEGKTDVERLSATTVNGYMGKLNAFLAFAAQEDLIIKNPAKGLGVIEDTAKKDRRRPFSADQLRRIFHAPLYTGCRDDEYGYAEPGPDRPRRGRFWIPLIALFGGLRMNEVCQLHTTDVRLIDGVHCFAITADQSHEDAPKKLKTRNSERLLPIHPELIRIGILDYVAERRRKRDVRLFPELPMASSGYYSDVYSKWFARFLAKVGATGERTSFHSFRHNFRDALREAGISREVALSLGGWAGGGRIDGSESAEAYGQGFRAQTLFSAISRVTYPDLDLSHLYPQGGPA